MEVLPKDLGVSIERPIKISCDGVQSLMLVENLNFHAITEPINVHQHYVWEKVID